VVAFPSGLFYLHFFDIFYCAIGKYIYCIIFLVVLRYVNHLKDDGGRVMARIVESFQYNGQTIVIREVQTNTECFVKLEVGGLLEKVEPKINGFLTGPRSKISILFGAKGTLFIPAPDCSIKVFEKVKRHRILSDKHDIQKWLMKHVGAQGGLVYGELRPELPIGWYIVLMMKVSAFGGYIEFPEPGYKYLGKENEYCKEFISNKKANSVYNNGVEFFVTTLTPKEAIDLYQG
jgi:hypothetical protein